MCFRKYPCLFSLTIDSKHVLIVYLYHILFCISNCIFKIYMPRFTLTPTMTQRLDNVQPALQTAYKHYRNEQLTNLWIVLGWGCRRRQTSTQHLANVSCFLGRFGSTYCECEWNNNSYKKADYSLSWINDSCFIYHVYINLRFSNNFNL